MQPGMCHRIAGIPLRASPSVASIAAWARRAPLGKVDLGLLAADVGVEDTQNVLEVGLVHDERAHGWPSVLWCVRSGLTSRSPRARVR
eukprot:scaffold242869_cov33-Tisochrysis_lutea.AAC.1